ncbi:hypothetical protein HRR83_008855 [Exophiala dermatitidis]|uniref:Uncharacterized protein n=1 Tax=Exophiala dermatitidis TaxID=5970 RepID=A0AAN6EL54_EXODE|nr:hypothetical protein HRR73_008969 [Exophiala dermatitidis]KAJ4506284.1 hypothetical protein HRR75_007139 [Exophiala dermatitidis]KAJ4508382.1 hypothetical protein HRR74_007781 [Exophiala dermatitidis]KAJ4533397.1 hypothetical protein HRR77_008562 [Exophiala dermatitidis]KAJ4538291.1 hypothetical protein HRR78_008175 [Exophiala dermatitidis]
MADDEWTYMRRRIPITRGWGPCKQTYWLPVDEHYTGNNGRRGRIVSWTLGLNPDALHDRHREVHHDDGDGLPGRYGGYRERPEYGGQRYPRHPDQGWNAVWPWQPPVPWNALDPAIAEDLQQLENMRAQRHRERIERQNREIAEIDGRAIQHIQGMQDNLRDQGDEGRLRRLRAELAVADENRQRREQDHARAQQERERERARQERYHAAMERQRLARRRGRPNRGWERW